MAVFTRLFAVIAVAGGVGLLLTAVAFQLLNAAFSDGVLLGLAATLITGNFFLLRQGVSWAFQPQAKLAPVEESSGDLVLNPTH